MAVLSPYRVLDLTQSRGMLCGQMLGDLGADVVQVEPPGGAPGRARGPFHGDPADVNASLTWRAYARGKRSIELDWVADRATLLRLIDTCDVLIEAETPGALAAFGLDYATLAQRRADLVYVSISPYGQSGPKAQWPSSDLTLVASAGPLSISGDEDRPPVRVGEPQAWNHAAAEAAVGALAALHERVTSGLGQHVDVAVQKALTLATQGNILSSAVGESTPQRIAGGVNAGGLRIQLTYPALDGYVSISHLFGATIGPATRRLMEYVHDEGFCDAATRDKDWIEYGLLLADGTEPVSEFERAKACVAACTASKTKAELLAAAMERRLLLAPITTIADVVASEQFEQRNYFVHPEGSTFAYPGPFARFSARPLDVRRGPPNVGQHTAEILRELETATIAPTPGTQANTGRAASQAPLAGVKVLDFMWAIAGPGATRILADLGATVVRVESSRRLDVCRTIRPFIDGDTSAEKSALFHTTNAGKRLISLDLTRPEGRAVALDLVRWADVVAESFSPRAMKSFGLDYPALTEVNPEVIMLSTCLMGQTGPLSPFAGYGNLAAAIAGFYEITGWADREPAGPFGAYTDYIAPRYNAAAVLAALDYRRRTGKGQHIDLAQAEAALHFVAPAVLDYTANGVIAGRRGNRDLQFAPHGVYPTAGEDRHIAIVCETDSQWRALRQLLPELTDGLPAGELEQAAGRLDNVAALDDRLAQLTADWEGAELEAKLQAAGVPVSRVLNSPELVSDAQLRHLGHFVELPHHEGGSTVIESSRIRLSRSPLVEETTAPTFGRDMMYVLQEVLRYDDEQIGNLLVSGVLE